MKKAYLVRYGAYGDHINTTCVVKALDLEEWHITYEYNYKGAQIHTHNPRIDEHVVFEPSEIKSREEMAAWCKRLDGLKNEYDLVCNFSNSLERSLIAPESSPEYFWPLRERRAKNTHTNYYDQSMVWSGLTDKKYMGQSGELFFSHDEHEHVRRQVWPYRYKFLILWALRGTMYQKAMYPIAADICNAFLDRHKDAVIITTGDDFCKKWEWEYPNGLTISPESGLGEDARLIHKSARMPFRQAMNIARYANLVVTPETGLGIASGAMGVPKIMMLTAASLKNIVGNDKHDFSLQSDAWCSPCTRAIYNTNNCTLNPKTGLPICVDFDKGRVLEQMERAYELHYVQNWYAPPQAGSAYV